MSPAVDFPGQAPDRLGLLCADIKDANFLTAIVAGMRPGLPVDVAFSREALEDWAGRITPSSRLIAFCASVVVPPAILEALGGPAYNFHPGPPAYPGKYPAVFALYDGASVFGATLHEMRARVDSGPIVGVTEFAVPPNVDGRWLEARAHQAALHLFLCGVRDLIFHPEPLAPLPVSWGNRRCGRRAFEDLRTIGSDVDPNDLERRIRVVQQVPGATLAMLVHGRRFELKP